jgi:hypothetical protein
MILLYALIFILGEAITEGLLKRFNKAEWLFDNFIQWVVAIFLFGLWFIIAYHFDGYYVPVWKLIVGMISVRFALFDVIWNISRGVKWNYYGTTKLYDRIMFKLSSFGWMMKGIFGIMGICFLLGIDGSDVVRVIKSIL